MTRVMREVGWSRIVCTTYFGRRTMMLKVVGVQELEADMAGGLYVTEPDPLSGGKEERPIAPKDGCMNTVMNVKIVEWMGRCNLPHRAKKHDKRFREQCPIVN